MEQHLRVLSVRDGKEWLLPMRVGEQHIQVAALKRLVLEQQERADASVAPRIRESKKTQSHQQRRDDDTEHKSEANDEASDTNGYDNDDDDAMSDSGSESFVMFRGRILADMDFFNLHTLTPSDFFVFAHELPNDDDCAVLADAAECDDVNGPNNQRHKRKRSRTNPDDAMSALQHAMVEQLVEMGFVAAQARSAVQHCSDDLTTAIAILTGDTRVLAARNASSHTNALMRAHPKLRVLEPALTELSDLDVPRIAARDTFQAIMRVKEHVPNEVLAPLVANPCAAVEFLRLPLPSPSSTASQPETRSHDDGSHQDLAIDLATESPPVVVTTDPPNSSSADTAADGLMAIERIASMGFDRDLVVAVYESCGNNEEAALHALCEMLH